MTFHPHETTSAFFGRRKELSDIAALFANPACRLLTLVGPGGIGKTRLAIEASGRIPFVDGVYFIPLQPLSSPDFMVSALASAIGIQFFPGSDPRQQLLGYFREKSLLLVLDNLEHLLDGVVLFSEILTAAPEVRILVTSRERLNLREEWVLEVGGLEYPTNEVETDIAAYSAVELFLQHAHRANVNFTLAEEHRSALIRICRLVGGMPLAIELAATWVRALSCEAIADEISRSLDILETPARNVEPRHRNMRAAFEPTWKQLSEQERSLFMKLSAFRGGFTREAAEQVAGASLRMLSALVDKSLLRVDGHGRYDLHELLRQYGMEQLKSSGEVEATRDSHSAYYAAFLQDRWACQRNEQQAVAFREIDLEFENIHSAWQNMVDKLKIDEFLKSTYSLWFYADIRGHNHDAVMLCRQAAEALRPVAEDDASRRALGQVLIMWGMFCVSVGKPHEGQARVEEGLALLRNVGSPEDLVLAFRCLTFTNTYTNESLAMNRNAEQSVEIARRSGHAWLLAWALFELGFARIRIGELDEARQIGQECLKYAEISRDKWLTGACLSYLLGYISNELGAYATAKHQLEEGRSVLRQVVLQDDVATHISLGYNDFCMLDYQGAGDHYRQSLLLTEKNGGSTTHDSYTIIKIADLWAAQGKCEAAVELLTVVQRHPHDFPWTHIDVSEKMRHLQSRVSPEAFDAAQKRGKALELRQVVRDLITVLDRSVQVAPASQPLVDPLTERELEILRLIAEGMTNREIADQLVLAVSTVKWYVKEIFGKLHVGNRTQAVARARVLGVLS